MAESLFFDTADGEKLHVRFFSSKTRSEKPAPILFLHGAIENGRIFYSESGKGLAPYLATQGFDCYVLDLRGRGQSTPPISKKTAYGQTETVLHDIPLIIQQIKALNPPNTPLRIIAHSWGGVLMIATLARFPELIGQVSKIVFFGSKRSVKAITLERFLKVSLVWNTIAPLLSSIYGYLPARELKMGSDQESRKTHAHSRMWVKEVKNWIDPEDGFDYKEKLASLRLPPLLSILGTKDMALGHIQDAIRFLEESNIKHSKIFEVPYGHIDMLTSADAA